MNVVIVRTQSELDAAIANAQQDTRICIESPADMWLTLNATHAQVIAWGSAHVEAWESAHVEAWGSAQVEAWGSAHVEAWGSAHVVAWESAQVEAWESAHVVAWESAQVEAWESAQVVARGSAQVVARESAQVVARESAQVEAWGSAHVEAWGSVQVQAYDSSTVDLVSAFAVATQQSAHAQITGKGVIIPMSLITSVRQWADYYGAEQIDDTTLLLYKAVNDTYHSAHGGLYRPGTTPVASDWDGGDEECGGGLHFCATPIDCLRYYTTATRFIACPVLMADIVVHPNAQYPSKVKARAVAQPCWEVDRYGHRLGA